MCWTPQDLSQLAERVWSCGPVQHGEGPVRDYRWKDTDASLVSVPERSSQLYRTGFQQRIWAQNRVKRSRHVSAKPLQPFNKFHLFLCESLSLYWTSVTRFSIWSLNVNYSSSEIWSISLALEWIRTLLWVLLLVICCYLTVISAGMNDMFDSEWY